MTNPSHGFILTILIKDELEFPICVFGSMERAIEYAEGYIKRSSFKTSKWIGSTDRYCYIDILESDPKEPNYVALCIHKVPLDL